MNKIQYLITAILCLCCTSAHAAGDGEKDEILFISSYNTDSKYIYDTISSFFDAYMQLHGQYSPVVEGMNCTTLADSHLWVNEIRTLLEKHPKTKLVILMGPEAWVSYLSLTEEKYKKLPIFCVMSQRYCAALETNDIPAVYKPNASNNFKWDTLELMKEFNVQLCY